MEILEIRNTWHSTLTALALGIIVLSYLNVISEKVRKVNSRIRLLIARTKVRESHKTYAKLSIIRVPPKIDASFEGRMSRRNTTLTMGGTVLNSFYSKSGFVSPSVEVIGVDC